jgi:hypothetical protein
MPVPIHISIVSIIGSNFPEDATPEYTAPARSKNNPAYAHSSPFYLSRGTKMATAPINFATLINCIKYIG